MLKGLSMHALLVHNMHIKLSTEYHVLIHSFGCNFCDIFVPKLKESIAARTCSFDTSRHSQFGDLAKLLEKVLKLIFIETFRKMAYIKHCSS